MATDVVTLINLQHIRKKSLSVRTCFLLFMFQLIFTNKSQQNRFNHDLLAPWYNNVNTNVFGIFNIRHFLMKENEII